MNCPHCDFDKSATTLTIPANKRTDGNVYRRRRCKRCEKEFSTLEMYLDAAKAAERVQEIVVEVAAPTILPHLTGKTPDALNIDEELEKMLAPAITTIHDVLKPGNAVHKMRAETAKWIIEDRRDRRAGLPGAGQLPKDSEQIRELGKLLTLVPDLPDEEQAG